MERESHAPTAPDEGAARPLGNMKGRAEAIRQAAERVEELPYLSRPAALGAVMADALALLVDMGAELDELAGGRDDHTP